MAQDARLDILADLVQLDVDAVGAYEAALRRVSDTRVHACLSAFRMDHLRHIEHLNALIAHLGGRRVVGKPGFKGVVLERFTAVTSWMGTDGALIAMVGNEELSGRRYEGALKLRWDEDSKLVVQRNLEAERRHLAWIKAELRRRATGRGQEAAAHS